MSPRDIGPGCHSLPLGNEPRWWRMPYKIREADIRSAHGLPPSTLYNSGFVGNGSLTGWRDFLYVADCKLTSTENMAYIHQHQGWFLTMLPRTRTEDKAFQGSLESGQVQWRHIHDKRNDNGEIVDQYTVSEPATLSVERYRPVWYHSTVSVRDHHPCGGW
jgi:hypothetical protein